MFTKFNKHFEKHYKKNKLDDLKNLFAKDNKRHQQFLLETAGLCLDYSRQPIIVETKTLLDQFCQEVNLKEKIEAMFQGQNINVTEHRPALHVALRQSTNPNLKVNGIIIEKEINQELEKVAEIVERLHKKLWLGANNKAITDVINIGIGGSDLGPRMVTHALKPYHHPDIKVHFVANVDGTEIFETLKNLNPETTLFIIASKSFTTEETLLNAKTAKAWLTAHFPSQDISQHFIGITAKPEIAIAWGIKTEHLFTMWDFIGGRYSLWSSIGLPIAIQIGMQHFRSLLEGAHTLDQHFLSAQPSKNLPILMAFLAIINQNIYGAQSHAVIPYNQHLELLPSYLQQLDMESNGKRISCDNKAIDYQTSVSLWGGVGTNGQHAFHQLLHQGTSRIGIDFILSLKAHHHYPEHQQALIANCLAQAEALCYGKDLDIATAEFKAMGYSEIEAKQLAPHKVIPGNRPLNIIMMESLNPNTLGALVALYEHKVYIQSLFWNINAFDQWGVELGKQLAIPILKKVQRLNRTTFNTLIDAIRGE